ncbi:MAG: glycosyltransferase family 39 protein [Acidobacteria bacterium]|nr:glycosyltransferase family 39 protein [Acidobacteriota bacterium]MBS1865314.1 glycosyltransferase family 39 protein [Acidobacteriota bacterium]
MMDLSRPPLLDDVDSVHAEAGREMAERGDWVTVYTNGIRYMEKAPLMYWSIAASYKIFGVKEWTARLPLMLGVIALVLSTYLLGRYAFGAAAGFYAALALVTSIGVYLYTRFLIPEVLIALWFTLGYYFFLRILDEERPSRFVCWGFAATCALNVLTKGLIGLVFPVGAIGLFILLTNNWRVLLKMRLISSTIVFFAIAAPWHVLAAIRTPAQGAAPSFLWLYFINEHLMRFLGKRVPAGFDTAPLGIFWGLTLAWLVPWIVFLPQSLQAVRTAWRELRLFPANSSRKHNATMLCFLWAFVILVFFSFSTRQEYYTVPALPGLALLIGSWLATEATTTSDESARRYGRVSSSALFAVGILAFAAGMFLLSVSHRPAPGVDLADLLTKNPEDYNLSLGHVMDLTPQALGSFRTPLLGASLGLLLGTGLNWLLRRRGRPNAANLALAGMMVVLLGCVHFSFIKFSPILSSYDLAQAIQKEIQPGDVIVVDGEYHEASTLNFYTRTQLHVLHEPSGNLWYGAKFPDAPHIFETPQSLAVLWNGSQRVFLWADHENPKELAGQNVFLLARSGGKYIFTNRPPVHSRAETQPHDRIRSWEAALPKSQRRILASL